MKTLRRAVAAIRRAEDELRGLLCEAVETGQYDEVLVLGEWAKQLHTLIAGPQTERSENGDDITAPTVGTDAGGAGEIAPTLVPVLAAPAAIRRGNGKPLESATKRSQLKQRKKGGAKTSSRRFPEATTYPKFLRDGDQLIKIGWSKKEKAQYEHKAPKSVLGPLLQSLLAAGGDGHRFTTDDVLPLGEAGDGLEIPSYQSYLCIAWLRSEELIVQHGRQGYSLPQPDRFAASVEESWERLSRR